MLRCGIHKLTDSVWYKEELPHSFEAGCGVLRREIWLALLGRYWINWTQIHNQVQQHRKHSFPGVTDL